MSFSYQSANCSVINTKRKSFGVIAISLMKLNWKCGIEHWRNVFYVRFVRGGLNSLWRSQGLEVRSNFRIVHLCFVKRDWWGILFFVFVCYETVAMKTLWFYSTIIMYDHSRTLHFNSIIIYVSIEIDISFVNNGWVYFCLWQIEIAKFSQWI
jgi:hypothetical protein